MDRIKTKLIHLLGGETEEESADHRRTGFQLGYMYARREILKFADSLYGCSAEEWCKKMYEELFKSGE